MVHLTADTIRLAAQPASKAEAIRQVGQLLVDAGHIAPGYIESMLGREQQANTYLGNGIAIPHGMGKDRALIEHTGIAVLQVPSGVTWNDGETAFLIVGIAARSDEHLAILARLVSVLEDTDLVLQLAQTSDSAAIARSLNADTTPPPAVAHSRSNGVGWEHAVTAEVVVANQAGLHARPATGFVEIAKRYTADVRVVHGEQTANGKALASLLKLGVESGTRIHIQARGDDAPQAVEALVVAVERMVEEDATQHEPIASEVWTPPTSGLKTVTGVAASPGVAVGMIHYVKKSSVSVHDNASDPATEKQALRYALATAGQQLDDVYESVRKRVGRGEADIFLAHRALLYDPDLIAEVETTINAGHSAAWSWQHVITQRVEELKHHAGERFAGRAADLHDVGQRMLRVLAGTEESSAPPPDAPMIMIADDLLPSDTAHLDPQMTLGLCTVLGGPTSHTAIIARSLGIPAVVGAGAGLLELANGTPAIIDGAAGRLYLQPDDASIADAQGFMQHLATIRNAEYHDRYQPALTSDGHRVEIVANIGAPHEAALAVKAGAEGIGLLRTEFLFQDSDSPPSEDEQYAAYHEMVQALNGLPLIIRTMDIGGDKNVPYINLPPEANPFLGVRGIRLSLHMPDLFRTQLRAIYRVASDGPVKLMFPMITTLEDLHAAKSIAAEVRRELNAPAIAIGIMVEVPSTALLAEEFAPEVDFFSIGTNDLTQYTLATDRLHPTLSRTVDGLHPAVLRLIDRTVRAARNHGKWVGVCGGVAGEPLGAIILTGLGVSELSMSIPSVAAVKARLRNLSYRQMQTVAQQALAARTAHEVRNLRV